MANTPTPVLIVDDNELVRTHIARVLTKAGFAPTVACDGPDALAKAAAMESCPLLATDIMMPGMTGPELAQQLRQRDPGIKVLYLTGLARRLLSERTPLVPDEAYLEKPATPEALIEAVRSLLAGRLREVPLGAGAIL